MSKKVNMFDLSLPNSIQLNDCIRESKVYLVEINPDSQYPNHYTVMLSDERSLEKNLNKFIGKECWIREALVEKKGDLQALADKLIELGWESKTFISAFWNESLGQQCLSKYPVHLNGQKSPLNFDQIPQQHLANYSVNVSWNYLNKTLDRYKEEYQLDIDPDFQRGHKWTKEQQIAYVEFRLQGGVSARHLLFNCPGWQDFGNAGPMQLVDGKQRLQAVQLFIDNKLPIFGDYLLKEIRGYISSQCFDFIVCVNNLATREEVLTWYLQLNDGGVVHTKEEIDKVRDLPASKKAKV